MEQKILSLLILMIAFAIRISSILAQNSNQTDAIESSVVRNSYIDSLEAKLQDSSSYSQDEIYEKSQKLYCVWVKAFSSTRGTHTFGVKQYQTSENKYGLKIGIKGGFPCFPQNSSEVNFIVENLNKNGVTLTPRAKEQIDKHKTTPKELDQLFYALQNHVCRSGKCEDSDKLQIDRSRTCVPCDAISEKDKQLNKESCAEFVELEDVECGAMVNSGLLSFWILLTILMMLSCWIDELEP